MTNKIKTSFDSIRAEEKLKSDTKLYLQGIIQKQAKARERLTFRKYTAVFATVIIFFVSGVFMYNLYYTPVMYLDVDVNPSIELAVNRFDRVISSRSYNVEGDYIINSVSLMHKSYEDTLIILMETIAREGYFNGGELVSVTLQINNKAKEGALMTDIQNEIEVYMTEHHRTAQIDVFSVSDDTRNTSREQGVSPAKYLAIQRLIEVDPTASVESCRDHSISEINQLVKQHGGHHGDDGENSSEASQDSETNYDSDDYDEEPQMQNSVPLKQTGGHHGENNSKGHGKKH